MKYDNILHLVRWFKNHLPTRRGMGKGLPLRIEPPTDPRKPYNTGSFGSHCTLNYPQRFKIGYGSTYNDFCWFNARFGITIGENTLMGPRVLIHSGDHVIKPLDIEQNATGIGSWCEDDRNKRVAGSPIIIGNDVWIGANVTILAGSIIPNKCVIGAGAIITKSNSRLLKPGDVVVNDIKLKILGNRSDIHI